MTAVVADGYTVVLCAAPGCRAAKPDEVASALRDCVRSSRYGVLVASGCLLGPLTCLLRPAGPLVLVQPCDAQRRPTRPAIRIGPLSSADDVAAVRDWLRAARFDPAQLPAHLTEVHRWTRTSATN